MSTTVNVMPTVRKDLSLNTFPLMKGNQIKPVSVQVLPYKRSEVQAYRRRIFSKNEFQTPEYDLYEISSAEDADGIIRRAIQKKRALADKEGWTIVGKNNKTIAYIKQRLLEMSLCQNSPIELLIKDTIGDLIRYHNAFWRLVRDERVSSGKTRRVRTSNGWKTLEPIAAAFRVPPETMRAKTDDFGNVRRWMQVMPDGRSSEFRPEDIVHFVFNKRAGFIFSAPGLLPAVDEARALRRLEENVELLVEHHLFPLFVLKIGTDEWPVETYPDNTTEVDVWSGKMQNIPTNGSIVVSHRHTFEVVESKQVLQMKDYLEHFKKRLYTSAGVSSLDMGEGDGMNRSTADNASKILIEDVKDYQKEFQYQFDFHILKELLLERFDITVLSEENVVSFKWKEIDIENMIKLENHNALMYTMNFKTEDEARLAVGYNVIDDEKIRGKMFFNVVDMPKIKVQAAVKEASKAQNSSSNRNTPSNQHGKALGPTKRKSSMDGMFPALSLVMNDFNTYSRDLTKLRLKNTVFSIDLSDFSSDICYKLNLVIDQSVDNAFDLLEKGEITGIEAKDLVLEQLDTLLTSEQALDEESIS